MQIIFTDIEVYHVKYFQQYVLNMFYRVEKYLIFFIAFFLMNI